MSIDYMRVFDISAPQMQIMIIATECLETESNDDNLQVRSLQLYVPWLGLLRQAGDGKRTET